MSPASISLRVEIILTFGNVNLSRYFRYYLFRDIIYFTRLIIEIIARLCLLNFIREQDWENKGANFNEASAAAS